MKCPKCKFYNICKDRLNETVENCVRFKSVEQTNFENIAKNEDTLAKWLSDKIHFCREVSCDECKINCANDDVNVTNADLWSAWLKQPHTTRSDGNG